MRQRDSGSPERCRVAAHAAGDGRAERVRQALGRFEVPLLRYAARLLRDPERARDVVQDAFMKMWAADQATLDGHLGQWLFKVVRNGALDVRRKESRMRTIECTDAQTNQREGASGHFDAGEPSQPLSRALCALQDLPEKQQEAIRLKFQGGLSYAEIANVMEITVNYVGVLIHTGLKTIRETLTTDAQAAASKAQA